MSTSAIVTADSDQPVATIRAEFLRSEISLRNATDGSLSAFVKSYLRLLRAQYTIQDVSGSKIGILSQDLSILGVPTIGLMVGDDQIEFRWSGDPQGCAKWWASLRRNDFDMVWNGHTVGSFRSQNTVLRRGIVVDLHDCEGFAMDRRVAILAAYLLLTTRPVF